MICPICNGVAHLLGVLGCLAWYRCRDCGMEFEHDYDAEEAEMEEAYV